MNITLIKLSEFFKINQVEGEVKVWIKLKFNHYISNWLLALTPAQVYKEIVPQNSEFFELFQ